MSDQADPSGDTAFQAADRLEQALERIAAHAQDAHTESGGVEGELSVGKAEIRQRLDLLISHLRETLGESDELNPG